MSDVICQTVSQAVIHASSGLHSESGLCFLRFGRCFGRLGKCPSLRRGLDAEERLPDDLPGRVLRHLHEGLGLHAHRDHHLAPRRELLLERFRDRRLIGVAECFWKKTSKARAHQRIKTTSLSVQKRLELLKSRCLCRCVEGYLAQTRRSTGA